jgi:hypothetical protein
MPKTMTKSTKSAAPGNERNTTVHVKSLRNPPLDVRLPGLSPSTTSVLDIKTAVATQTGVPLDKLKLLWNKKPVPDSKVLRDVLGGPDVEIPDTVEFSAMVMGGAAILVKPPTAGAADVDMSGGDSVVAQGVSGKPVMETDEFWSDLKGFLQQRIRDEKVAEEATMRFKNAWSSST